MSAKIHLELSADPSVFARLSHVTLKFRPEKTGKSQAEPIGPVAKVKSAEPSSISRAQSSSSSFLTIHPDHPVRGSCSCRSDDTIDIRLVGSSRPFERQESQWGAVGPIPPSLPQVDDKSPLSEAEEKSEVEENPDDVDFGTFAKLMLSQLDAKMKQLQTVSVKRGSEQAEVPIEDVGGRIECQPPDCRHGCDGHSTGDVRVEQLSLPRSADDGDEWEDDSDSDKSEAAADQPDLSTLPFYQEEGQKERDSAPKSPVNGTELNRTES